MRLLFRFFSLVVLVLTVYFFLNQNFSAQNQREPDWVVVKNQTGMELSFPGKPKSQTIQKNYPVIGPGQLHSFQVQNDKELFALLIVSASHSELASLRLDSIEKTIHSINDTDGMKIRAKRHFQYQNFPALEYQAIRPGGHAIWCRTIHTGKALVSLIYAHEAGRPEQKHRDRYFNSLKL